MQIPRIMIIVLLIVLVETSAITCFKKSLEDGRFFLLGVLLYGLVGFLLCQSFKQKGMAFTNALWSAMSVVATTLVGVMLFKETLHGHDYIAVALIIGGVMILKITD